MRLTAHPIKSYVTLFPQTIECVEFSFHYIYVVFPTLLCKPLVDVNSSVIKEIFITIVIPQLINIISENHSYVIRL